MIDVAGGLEKLFQGIADEVNEGIGGHPVAQIAGQQHRGLAVESDEVCGPQGLIPQPLLRLNYRKKYHRPSPTGC